MTHRHRWAHVDGVLNRFRCVLDGCEAVSCRVGSSFHILKNKTMRDWTIERDEQGRPVRLVGGVKR